MQTAAVAHTLLLRAPLLVNIYVQSDLDLFVDTFWKMSLLAVTVRWLLVGCCGLALLHFTGANQALRISQKPRYYSGPSHQNIKIFCISSKQHLPSNVSWYKAANADATKDPIKSDKRRFFRNVTVTQNGVLFLNDLNKMDKGVYFCKIGDVFGPGTEVHLGNYVNVDVFLYRTQMKDGLIILQGLLLAVYIAAYVFRQKTMSERKECIYEEPEVDHIYEGLAIETCEGDLYEEISVYAQAEGAEAPWE